MSAGHRKPVPLPEARWPSAEEARAARLFSPCRVGPWEAAERTWVPAMVPWRATGDGKVTADNLDWYGRFARGQPGVLVAEATGIRDIESGPLLRIGSDAFVPGLRDLVERVREESEGRTRFLIQIIDFLTVRRRPEVEKFFARFWKPTTAHRERLAAHDDEESWLTSSDASLRTHLAAGDAGLWAAVLA
ncbi:MAG: NADH:flavin oxidoreductase, partial [Planctomycetota bacterium]|nr:NADH:flavin oxidoreductase [Planctomycetota bacterium]